MRTYKLNFFLILSLLLGHFLCLEAQTNGNMEGWTPSGSPPPFNWLYPTGWTTNNATTEFTTSGTKRSTDAHSGSYAAELRTLNVFGTLTRSLMVLGNATLDYPNYSVIMHTGGEAMSSIPMQVNFYYKLVTGATTENAVAEVLIKRPSGDVDPDTVYYELIELTPANEYTLISRLIPDVEINITTDSIILAFASNTTEESGENFLYIDDVSIDFASAVESPFVQQAVHVYPNPVHSNQSFFVKTHLQEEVEIYDITGKRVHDWSINQMNDGLEISVSDDMSPGLYALRLGNGQVTKVMVLE